MDEIRIVCPYDLIVTTIMPFTDYAFYAMRADVAGDSKPRETLASVGPGRGQTEMNYQA